MSGPECEMSRLHPSIVEGYFCPECGVGRLSLDAEMARAGGVVSRWVPVSESLPDSDVWVLAVSHEGDYVLVQLEFSDDSDGNGEPYWAGDSGTCWMRDYPHWMPLPKPPAKEAT